MTVGLLHPGAMGAAVGAALVGSGHEVVWASEGRSDATRARAEAAGLVDAGTVRELADRSELVISLCPPEYAVAVADELRGTGFEGVFVDANAVSPETAQRIAPTVDGGVIGPPPRVPGTTRLYLSGPGAREVADRFSGTALGAHVVDDRVGSASALKMVYAAYTKGISALLLALRETSRAHGVDDALLAEWEISQPQLAGLCELAQANAGPKAWRWIAEMEEIAATFAAAGQPDGFHLAAAEVYRVAGRADERAMTMDAARLEAARAAKGFMPEDEGLALHDAGLDGGRVGPLLEIGSYCGKSAVYLGAAAEEQKTVLFTIDHHHGSEENQAGWEHHDQDVVDPRTGRMDTLPFFRRTIEDAGLEGAVVAIVGDSPTVGRFWHTPVGLLFIDGGHAEDVAMADYEGWAHHVAPEGILAIHDVFEHPEDGGQAPFRVWQHAVADGFTPVATTGSLRTLRR